MHQGEEWKEYTGAQLLAAGAGITLAPLAWIGSFLVKYMIVPFACQSGTVWFLHLISPAAFVIACLGLFAAYRTWQLGGGGWPGEEHDTAGRNRFLGVFGMLLGACMLLLIIAQWIPVFLLDPCIPG
jgi:hypothetical protein